MFFDWISPMLQIGSHLTGMQGMNIYMPGSGKTGKEVADLLTANGVKVGPTPFFVGDSMSITVDDREKARRILRQHGIGG